MTFAGVAIGVGVAGTVAGGVLGAQGAASSAKATKQAAKDNLDFTQGQFDQSKIAGLYSILGPQQADAYLRATLPTKRYNELFGTPAKAASFTDDQRKQLDYINSQLALPTYVTGVGNPLLRAAGNTSGSSTNSITREQRTSLEKQKADLLALAGGDPGTTGQYDLSQLRALGPGVTDEMRKITESYGASTAGLTDYARSIEQQARGYGDQERARINRDADQALTSLNRNTQASLIGRGLGASTVLTGALGQNARNINASREDALGSLGDRQINLLTGIRGNTLNLLSARSDGATQLAQQPINTKLQLLTGGIVNPWQDRDTSQYFPGVSPTGAAFSTTGNLLAGAGGQYSSLGVSQLLKNNAPRN